jgi:prevent-host-death family protein
MTREVPVTQARADLAELVSRVGYTGERIVLTRHGKPLAALVPMDDLEALERPPAEIGFSITPPAPAEPEPDRPMRIAAEHRERKPGWRR